MKQALQLKCPACRRFLARIDRRKTSPGFEAMGACISINALHAHGGTAASRSSVTQQSRHRNLERSNTSIDCQAYISEQPAGIPLSIGLGGHSPTCSHHTGSDCSPIEALLQVRTVQDWESATCCMCRHGSPMDGFCCIAKLRS